MTCWIVVYAVSVTGTTPFSNRKKTSDGVLTYQEWNAIMDNLDSLNVEWWDDSIPAWAVMAFNKEECPTWWHEFTNAQGRFILWRRKNWYEFGEMSGVAQLWLRIDQIPEHFHYMIADDKVGSNWFRDNPDLWKNRYLAERWDSGDWDNNDQYDLAATTKPPIYARTSSVWNWNVINIMNPYIALLYCEKD